MRRLAPVSLAAALVAAASPVSAQSPVPRLAVSGYIQPQYEHVAREGREPTDRGFLRRAVLTVDARPLPDWNARVQVDFGPATSNGTVLLRDALLRWNGWDARGLAISVGNQKLPFSRAYLLPATRRGLIERPAPGLRGYGTPGRTVSARLDGHAAQRRLQWAAAVGAAGHRPDASAVRIDGGVESAEDWNEGVITAGRVEWHPFGDTPREQGWFGGPPRLVVGLGGYLWHNDGDRNLYTAAGGHTTSSTHADLQDARVLEISAGFRGGRTSIDVEYHRLEGRTVDQQFDGGLYRDGTAHLQLFGVEAGVMLLPRRFEALAGFDGVRASTHEETIVGPALGVSCYLAGHDLKLSLMYRAVRNDGFVAGTRSDATVAQAQIAF